MGTPAGRLRSTGRSDPIRVLIVDDHAVVRTGIKLMLAAEHVSIVLSQRGSSVAATIDDDGAGFDEAEVRADALGLTGMRERLALVGGALEIESTPGRGTTVAAQVPVVTG